MTPFLRLLMSGLVLGVLAAGFSLGSPQGVHACSCEPPPEPDEARENADYVFAGEVVEISTADSDSYRDIAFHVSEAWKGVEHQEMSVGTPDQSGACGYSFEEDSSYLVYASDNNSPRGPDVITGICQRTESLSLAAEDLQVLGTGTDAEELEEGEQTDDGLDLWMLFGSIALFLAIVVAIQLLRRWR